MFSFFVFFSSVFTPKKIHFQKSKSVNELHEEKKNFTSSLDVDICILYVRACITTQKVHTIRSHTGENIIIITLYAVLSVDVLINCLKSVLKLEMKLNQLRSTYFYFSSTASMYVLNIQHLFCCCAM